MDFWKRIFLFKKGWFSGCLASDFSAEYWEDWFAPCNGFLQISTGFFQGTYLKNWGSHTWPEIKGSCLWPPTTMADEVGSVFHHLAMMVSSTGFFLVMCFYSGGSMNSSHIFSISPKPRRRRREWWTVQPFAMAGTIESFCEGLPE